jgi:hypothetical protein
MDGGRGTGVIWQHGVYVCGWCSGMVLGTPDGGARCLCCGRDVVVTPMAEHLRLRQERLDLEELRQAEAPRQAFRRGRPLRSVRRTPQLPEGGYRDQSLREIMERLKSFTSLDIQREIGTVGETTTEGYCRLYERRGLIARVNEPIRWRGERLIYAWVGDAAARVAS